MIIKTGYQNKHPAKCQRWCLLTKMLSQLCVREVFFFSCAKKQTSRIDGKRTITVISAPCVCTAHGMKSLLKSVCVTLHVGLCRLPAAFYRYEWQLQNRKAGGWLALTFTTHTALDVFCVFRVYVYVLLPAWIWISIETDMNMCYI